MHYDKATLHFSYAQFEASVGMEDEEVGCEAPNTSFLCESMYAKLERSLSEIEHAQVIFELTVAQPTLNIPELLCKDCIDYEYETSGDEYERTRQVYEGLLDRTKHLKVWISYVKFEASVGMEDEEVGCGAPNTSLLYRSMYAELKRSLSEIERARAICELTVAQPTLDMPELLCKACIDYEYETSGSEYERIRQVYERLFDRTKYLKVWISYTKFEASIGMEDEEMGCGASNASLLCRSMYTELERSLSEIEHAGAIFKLTIAQPTLDIPKLLCKACIDYEYETSGERLCKACIDYEYETSEGEYERTRQVYERLFDRTKHLKVWISYAKLEASVGMKDEETDTLMLLSNTLLCFEQLC
uniref:Pre-mRNA-splicing factor clf1-like n=1 Tax=Elaeis guineensis var. tenera TaxID=51953 RepID=A0A6I9S586_ELAGV|nr:pre-mRNA-splicing factor clf1-like [Elaeis guineensis]